MNTSAFSIRFFPCVDDIDPALSYMDSFLRSPAFENAISTSAENFAGKTDCTKETTAR